MCTLAVAFRMYPGYPLVVAANRDERLDRPAGPPRKWPGEVPFFAPVDLVGGGSWLGLNARGLFVGVTNRFGVERDHARESRGTLVTESLRAPSAAALHDTLSRLAPSRFNAFHLFYADRDDAFITWSDGTAVRQQRLSPGLHVITERSVGGEDHSRTELVRSRWPKRNPVPSAEELSALLAIHHEDDPLGSTCVHAPAFNYGTRSSLVLMLAETPASSRWLWADAPPCQSPHRELPFPTFANDG
jgi:uncharacterized protein with NRDE domain